MTVAVGAPARKDAALLVWGIALPAAAGAAAVLGFAPFHAWPVPVAALAVLFLAWTRSGSALQAAISGFAFGLGLNLAGVSWVFVAIHDFGHTGAPLAVILPLVWRRWRRPSSFRRPQAVPYRSRPGQEASASWSKGNGGCGWCRRDRARRGAYEYP